MYLIIMSSRYVWNEISSGANWWWHIKTLSKLQWEQKHFFHSVFIFFSQTQQYEIIFWNYQKTVSNHTYRHIMLSVLSVRRLVKMNRLVTFAQFGNNVYLSIYTHDSIDRLISTWPKFCTSTKSLTNEVNFSVR